VVSSLLVGHLCDVGSALLLPKMVIEKVTTYSHFQPF